MRLPGPARRLTVAVALAATAGALAVTAAGSATAAPRPARGAAPAAVTYGSCTESVRIHRSADVNSDAVGLCAKGDQVRWDRRGSGGTAPCPRAGTTTRAWLHLRDLHTDVVGYVPACYVAEPV